MICVLNFKIKIGMKKLMKVLTGLLLTACAALAIGAGTGLDRNGVAALFGGFVCFSVLVPKPKGVAMMAVNVEIWENDIIENLFKNNEFAEHAVSGDQYVLNGAVVHIPVAGAPSRSLKNATSFPITAVKRGDTDITYTLDNYFQAPKYVQNIEQYELSYQKRQSIIGEQQSQLVQDAMDGLLYNWSWATTATIGTTPGNSIKTTGGATALSLVSGATGQRKLFTKDIFSTIKYKMDAANIPPTGRYALLTANHYQQLIDGFTDTALTNFYRVADLNKGVVGSYLGYTVMMRSSVQRWRKDAQSGVFSPVDEQADAFAGAATDSAASVFWQENCVERARGSIGIFDNPGQAVYYGDVFSMNLRLGGRVRRGAGVWSVIEDIV